jgi:membrane protein DedA with SNARE-associated domain
MDEKDLRDASTWLQQHGRGAVFYGRLIPGVRSLISLPAGAQRMPLASFTFATAAGSLLWTSLLVGAGYTLGSNWEKVGSYVSVLSNLVIVLLLVFATATVIVRARRRNRVEPASDDVAQGACGSSSLTPSRTGELG